jgi:ferredoxin
MRHVDLSTRFEGLEVEVELGFDVAEALKEVERCLNCDMETHFTDKLCIECDACVDICPVQCLIITPNAEEAELRERTPAPAHNTSQPLFASGELPQTRRIMIKDEDICIHCGLCAERCPTAAWDMRKFDLLQPYAGRPAAAAEELTHA